MNYDSREAGMHLHITVACQQCDDGFINTPALTADRARDCVESLGWVFVPDLGWTMRALNDLSTQGTSD